MLLLVFGMFFVMCSDCQKYFTLQTIRASDPNAKPLITEGMFKWTRNPNYLGEVIAFSSFCFLVNEVGPWIVYGGIWCTLFTSRMIQKDKRLHKKAGSAAYFNKTWMILPKFSACWLTNELIYLTAVSIVVGLCFAGGVENSIKTIRDIVVQFIPKK